MSGRQKTPDSSSSLYKNIHASIFAILLLLFFFKNKWRYFENFVGI
jgi:hypothetical protein